jgi:hypothetical protein
VLALSAVLGLALGGWFAARVNYTHDEHRRVTAVYGTSSNERPYGLTLDNGSNISFHNPPGMAVGEPIALRYDEMGRLLGTVRHGRYIAKAEQPPKAVLFLPLIAAVVFAIVAAGILVEPYWGLRTVNEGGWSLRGRIPGMTSWNMRRYASRHEAGLTTWISRDQLVAERRRMTWASSVLGLFVALWLLMIFTSPTGSILGTAILLEAVTCIPLALVGSRRHQLSKLLSRADALDRSAQGEDAEALQLVDESLMHIARLIAQLRAGPMRDSATDSFASAERACRAWRRLLDRGADIESLVKLTTDHRAQESLKRSLAECRRRTSEIQGEVEELAAAAAALVTASDDDVDEQLFRVAEAGERMALLASSLEDLGPLTGAPDDVAPSDPRRRPS